MRGLPGANDDLAHAAHRLAVAGEHGERAEIVEQVLRRNRFGADTRLGESDILRQIGIQMMADHEHVEMLVDGVDRVGPRWIGR